jgi:hypothetical protein
LEYLKFPPGCAARSEDWIFPASLEGQIEKILTTLSTPHLVPFPSNLSLSRNAAVFELPRTNLPHLNHISELLQLQEKTSIFSTMNVDQIHILLNNMKNEQPANHPFASTYLLSTAIVILFCCFGGISWYTLVLHRQLRRHLDFNIGLYERVDETHGVDQLTNRNLLEEPKIPSSNEWSHRGDGSLRGGICREYMEALLLLSYF